jgi:uncharacterized protein YdcH (DUF465 family)
MMGDTAFYIINGIFSLIVGVIIGLKLKDAEFMRMIDRLKDLNEENRHLRNHIRELERESNPRTRL